MKLSIIHNLYLRNPYVAESVRLNLKALSDANVQDYEYILFNDHGDEEIKEDIAEFTDSRIKYIYSDINYGKKMCSGGYTGAIPYITGDVIHITGQDDVMTAAFYMESMSWFNFSSDIYFVTSNGYKVNEQLCILDILIDPRHYMDCSKPLDIFKNWFGIGPPSYEVTKANNGFLAPGTIYKRKLHDLIGMVDLDNFRGAADFEYWSRILFNGYSGQYIPQPRWYYRISPYSAGNAIIDGKPNRGYWQQQNIEMIKQKYTQLVNQNKDKFK